MIPERCKKNGAKPHDCSAYCFEFIDGGPERWNLGKAWQIP